MRRQRWLAPCALSLLLLTRPQMVSAQDHAPPSAASSAATEQARELYRKGLSFAGQAQWDKAYAAYLAAWNLKRERQIAGNLGGAEYNLGLYADAAEHLTFFLRDRNETGTPEERSRRQDERARARTLLEEVRAKIGTLTIRVDQPGAEVRVDGQSK